MSLPSLSVQPVCPLELDVSDGTPKTSQVVEAGVG